MSAKNFTIKCILATKIGDSLLRDEEGNLLPIYPDTFYEKGIKGYWMLKQIGMTWVILRVMVML